MDSIINFLYWWNENIYLLKIIENMDNKLHSIILVIFILFLYPIPWAIVLTWIAQRKIELIFRCLWILAITAIVFISNFLIVIVYAPFMILHLFLYKKEKIVITKRVLSVSIFLIVLLQIKPIIDNYLYYFRCNPNELYRVELLDKSLSLKDLEWNKGVPNSKHNDGFPIYSSPVNKKTDIFGLKTHHLLLVKDDRLIAKKIAPITSTDWMSRMLGYMIGLKSGGGYCYPYNYNEKLITKLKELMNEKQNYNK